MKQRPIPFIALMVNAIRSGRKTQTRRIMKPQPTINGNCFSWEGHKPNSKLGAYHSFNHDAETTNIFLSGSCHLGAVGERLWVRETWRVAPSACEGWSMDDSEPCTGWIDYKAGGCAQKTAPNFEALERTVFGKGEVDWDFLPDRWKPSIFMPRWASRIHLEITEVRVQRLNDISDDDAIAEGCPGGHAAIPGYGYSATPLEHFRWVWESINGEGSWNENPWVWCINFKVIEGDAK